MYISIDMDKLVFLHKHADQDTVGALAFLEACDRSVRVDRVDDPDFLLSMSQTDLRMMYQNVAGRDSATKVEPGVLRNHLQRVAHHMDATKANPEEVQLQVSAVSEQLHKGTPYTYARGAKVPAKARELFPLPYKEGWWSIQLPGEKQVLPYPANMMARGYAYKEERASAPVVTESKPIGPTVTRTGAVRPVVRAAADKAWNDPERAAKGLAWEAVRATLIANLTAQGYHPTTIRIKLSEWAKDNKI